MAMEASSHALQCQPQTHPLLVILLSCAFYILQTPEDIRSRVIDSHPATQNQADGPGNYRGNDNDGGDGGHNNDNNDGGDGDDGSDDE